MYSQLNGSRASRRKFCKYSALAIASLLTTVGCRQQTTTAGNAASNPPLKIGLNLWAGFMPWQVAKEKNFFKANNLNAEIVWFPVLSDQITAFNAGKVDVIGITLYDFITSASNGVKSKIISITDMSLGADAIVVNPAIDSVGELAGKRTSVEVGTVGHLLFLKALEKGGITKDKVAVVNQSADAAIAALMTNRTDVAYAYEPFVSQAVAAGKGKVIFSSKDIPGLVPDLMIVQQSVIDRQPESVQKMLDVWYKTLAYRQSNLDEVLPIEAKQAGVSVQDYQNLLKGFKWLTPTEARAMFQPGTTPQSLVFNAEDVSSLMLKEKLIAKQLPPITELIDDRFLKKILT